MGHFCNSGLLSAAIVSAEPDGIGARPDGLDRNVNALPPCGSSAYTAAEHVRHSASRHLTVVVDMAWGGP